MKYDLKDIIIFTYVAKLGSFARACEVLNVAKSVASTRVSELEKAIGMNLLARTTREVNLTTDGKIFFNYCLEVLEKVDSIDYFLQKRSEICGILRIAIPPYFSRNHIVPHLKEFTEKYPQLKLEIFLTENNINIITECYDLQIRIQRPEEEALEVAKLTTNQKVICASSQYIKEYGEPKHPKDLLSHNCIVFGENTVWKFKSKTTGETLDLHDMAGNIKCNNGEIIKELVLGSNGITVKSSKDIQSEIQSGEIVLLLKDYEVINETEFYAVYPTRKYPSPKTKAFIEFLQVVFSRT
jgi:DNA-binding transcriptional LysR family regulator